jgi:lipopolysaccharide export system ATP-binding protein
MIAGGIRPSEGRVLLGEEEITELPMYRRARLGITYLPQEASIFRKLSVADNVNAILETVEPNRRARRERLRELLAELGLAEKAGRRGDTLSGGERRRVEITRALVLDPKFMLLDEPFAGIDPIAVIDIQKIISQLKDRGIGVIITDHNVRETLSICDHAYIIKDGHIIREGTPEEVAADPQVREIYLGENFRLS